MRLRRRIIGSVLTTLTCFLIGAGASFALTNEGGSQTPRSKGDGRPKARSSEEEAQRAWQVHEDRPRFNDQQKVIGDIENHIKEWTNDLAMKKENVDTLFANLKRSSNDLSRSHSELIQQAKKIVDQRKASGNTEAAEESSKQATELENEFTEWEKKSKLWNEQIEEWGKATREWESQRPRWLQLAGRMRGILNEVQNKVEIEKDRKKRAEAIKRADDQMNAFDMEIAELASGPDLLKAKLDQLATDATESDRSVGEWKKYVTEWQNKMKIEGEQNDGN